MNLIKKKGILVLLGAFAAIVLACLLAAGLSGTGADKAHAAAADTAVCAAQTENADGADGAFVACAASADAEALTGTDAAQTAADDGAQAGNSDGWKALAAGIAIGLAAGAGAAGMGIAVAKTSEAIARQPEAEGKIRSTLMLGLVFIETAIIYALIVAILVIFVL